jgi:hypothetical protein
MKKKQMMASLEYLLEALDAIEDAIILTEQAMNRNPNRDERRKLNEERTNLERRRFMLNNQVRLLARNSAKIDPPSDDQIEELKELSVKVDKATNKALNASEAIAMAGELLDMTSAMAG